MATFIEVPPARLSHNPFQAVGREWMLITAGTIDAFNTMTASWGAWGHLWNKDVAICFIRPQRHTYGFMETGETYTLSYFDKSWRKALEYCGAHSGREVDKIRETGLTPFATESGVVAFEQATLILECRKLYAADLHEAGFTDPQIRQQMYERDDFHRTYTGEILRALTRQAA